MILEFAVAGWGFSCWRFWVVTFGDVSVDNTPAQGTCVIPHFGSFHGMAEPAACGLACK